MSVSLSIVFTGLGALVSGGDSKPADVLLLDAQGIGQVRGITLPAHTPTLLVNLNDLANPDTSAPTRVVVGPGGPNGRVDQFGLWDLTGYTVRIRVQGESGAGVQYFRPAKNETSWPEPPRDANDPASWRDLRYVPDMMALVGDGRIDPALLSDGVPNELHRSVAARIHLDRGVLEGAIPSDDTHRDEMFEFKSEASGRTVRQALTDTARWTFQTEAGAVVIEITPAGGGTPKRLLLAPSASPHRLYVSNLPVENPSHADAHQGMSGDEMVALHFGAYYNLLLNEPVHRPLPTPWRPLDEQKGSGFIRPANCRPAMFSRP